MWVTRDISFFKSKAAKDKLTKSCQKCRERRLEYLKMGKIRPHIIEHIFTKEGECKKCSTCKKVLRLEKFSKASKKSDGRASKCKKCVKEYYQREEVRKKNSASRTEYYQKNKKKIQQYKKTNIEKTRIRNRNRYKTDTKYRLIKNLRNRISGAFRNSNRQKQAKSLDLIGCTIPFLINYITEKFLPGMTWESRSDWHIDHIKPCAAFDLSQKEEQYKCFHYTNLQPLWATDNLSKNDKWSEENEIIWQTFTLNYQELIQIGDTYEIFCIERE